MECPRLHAYAVPRRLHSKAKNIIQTCPSDPSRFSISRSLHAISCESVIPSSRKRRKNRKNHAAPYKSSINHIPSSSHQRNAMQDSQGTLKESKQTNKQANRHKIYMPEILDPKTEKAQSNQSPGRSIQNKVFDQARRGVRSVYCLSLRTPRPSFSRPGRPPKNQRLSSRPVRTPSLLSIVGRWRECWS